MGLSEWKGGVKNGAGHGGHLRWKCRLHIIDPYRCFGRISNVDYNGCFYCKFGDGRCRGVDYNGVRRAAFSNEAGIGTATLAHGAAKTKEPVREVWSR